jgi:hypothetical protein
MNKKSSYQVTGTDLYSIKSDVSTVPKSYGHPTISQYRCCPDNFGTT